MNLLHEFLGDAEIQISSETGFIPFSQDLGGTSIKAELGASLQLNASTTLFGNVDYEIGTNGDDWDIGGKIGLRVNW